MRTGKSTLGNSAIMCGMGRACLNQRITSSSTKESIATIKDAAKGSAGLIMGMSTKETSKTI